MRILVFDIPASRSGALTILKSFFSYVEEKGKNHEWCFVVGTDDLETRCNHVKIIKTHRTNMFRRIIWEVLFANKIISHYQPDIILSLQNIAIMFSSVPQIVYIHLSYPFLKEPKWSYFSPNEYFYAFRRDLFKFLMKKTIAKADEVIVQTVWMEEAIKRTFRNPDNKINVIPPSMDVNMNNFDHMENKNLTFFYPAEPVIQKNFEVIIEAVKILSVKGYRPLIKLTIKGDENKYSRKVRDLVGDLKDHFVFMGYLSREEILQQYRRNVLLFPSYLESFGLPLLEARFCRAPIIAADRPFSHEILDGYQQVEFFNPFSAGQLAEKMLKYLTLEETFVPNDDCNKFLEKYHPDNTWGKIIRLLEERYQKKQFSTRGREYHG